MAQRRHWGNIHFPASGLGRHQEAQDLHWPQRSRRSKAWMPSGCLPETTPHSLPESPGITSQVNYLPWNPSLRIHCWKNPQRQHPAPTSISCQLTPRTLPSSLSRAGVPANHRNAHRISRPAPNIPQVTRN